MADWFVTTKKADFNKLAEKFNITPMLARLIRNRDIVAEEEIDKFLYGTLEQLYPPEKLRDMDKAVSIIKEKIAHKNRIRIIGDYDIDGVCATHILKTGLEYCGATVSAVVPHRIHDGYGLNEKLIKQAYEDEIDTIITCDNGIAAYEQIEMAKNLGICVIITDHHEVPYEQGEDGKRMYKIPMADAVIDPKQPECSYPFCEICGAVVAYKVIEAILKSLGKETSILKELLEFAAIATIGDVMPILDENRIIVKYGLLSIRHTRNIGLKALLAVNGLEDKELTTYHIGFIIGPCLNASGRLDSADRALQLFATERAAEAAILANDLKALNDNRKEMTAKGLENAMEQLETTGHKKDKVLVVYLPECHESLAGIIAGRIREKYGKPAFVLTKGEECVKGSGRSIEAYHMYEELTRHNSYLLKYGGHKLAAGLSMMEENVDVFRRALNEDTSLCDKDFVEKIHIDIPMPIRFATKEFTEEMSLLEPYGIGNPKPLFAQREIHFIRGRVLGQNKNVGKYIVEDELKNRFDLVYFGPLDKFNEYLIEKFGMEQKLSLYEGKETRIQLSVCYYPDINEYRGNKTLQIVMKDYK